MDIRAALDAVAFALEHHPERVRFLPLLQLISNVARKNNSREARIELTLPDEIVRNIGGQESRRDLYMILQVPREIADAAPQSPRVWLPATTVPTGVRQ